MAVGPAEDVHHRSRVGRRGHNGPGIRGDGPFVDLREAHAQHLHGRLLRGPVGNRPAHQAIGNDVARRAVGGHIQREHARGAVHGQGRAVAESHRAAGCAQGIQGRGYVVRGVRAQPLLGMEDGGRGIQHVQHIHRGDLAVTVVPAGLRDGISGRLIIGGVAIGIQHGHRPIGEAGHHKGPGQKAPPYRRCAGLIGESLLLRAVDHHIHVEAADVIGRIVRQIIAEVRDLIGLVAPAIGHGGVTLARPRVVHIAVGSGHGGLDGHEHGIQRSLAAH